jgi:cytochrome c biogenesis protein CcmG/thiol:disulfide interchange protein DsbE
VVLNFWATWCVPCFEEHGVLTAGARELGSEVQFLGVVYEDEPSRVQAFLAERGGGYPSLVDPDSRTAIAYGVFGVPETFFIDASGSIVAKHVGPLTDAALAENVRKAREGQR